MNRTSLNTSHLFPVLSPGPSTIHKLLRVIKLCHKIMSRLTYISNIYSKIYIFIVFKSSRKPSTHLPTLWKTLDSHTLVDCKKLPGLL